MLLCYCLSILPHDFNSFPFKFPVFLMALFFMMIGYLLKRMDESLFFEKKVFSLFSILILASSVFLEIVTNNSVDMNGNQYGSIVIFLFTAIPISCELILLCKRINRMGRDFFCWLGRNTIYVVGFNYLIRDIAIEIYRLIPFHRHQQISFTGMFSLTFIFCIVLVLFCDKAKENCIHLPRDVV